MHNGGSTLFPTLPNVNLPVPDWEYNMRRTMQEIVPNVFLGPYSAAVRSKLQYLQEHGITHIVCIRHPIEANLIRANFPQHFKYLVLDIIDSPEEPIMRHFTQVKQFIDECISLQGKVLLHGNGGISRSAALTIAYLMETYGLPYQKAFCYVQQRRYCINPNEGFARQLVEYEPIYMARYQENCHSPGRRDLKRSHESDDELEESYKRDR